MMHFLTQLWKHKTACAWFQESIGRACVVACHLPQCFWSTSKSFLRAKMRQIATTTLGSYRPSYPSFFSISFFLCSRHLFLFFPSFVLKIFSFSFILILIFICIELFFELVVISCKLVVNCKIVVKL